MRNILFIIQKEFLQIFRNRFMLPIILVVPLVQLIIMVSAATLEMKNIKLTVVDKDLSGISRKLTSKFEGSPFFHIEKHTFSLEESEVDIKSNRTDMILHIPSGFEAQLLKEGQAEIQVLINAINATVAGLSNAYTLSVIQDFNQELLTEYSAVINLKPMKNIRINSSFWYNPDLNYKIFMTPGILVILVTMIGMILSSLNLVREKELGTAEMINVTPIRKYQFIIGKLIPFWILALIELCIGLGIGRLLYQLPVTGSLLLLLFYASIYLMVVMGIGLFMSAISNNQLQVMFLAFFFLITFILMSGIFTPVESMPDWAVKLNYINPLAYFMRVIRMVLLKGSGIADIIKETIYLSVYAVVILGLATWRYRKAA
ncbi:MAG: ABC transporter permease [Bacteroidales bacterium]|nr:ABC transporter permease [Bacteroidales bacterium]